MSINQKRLAGPTQLGTSSVAYYTVPAATTTIVKQVVLTNTTASAKTVTVRLVPGGESEGATPNSLDIISAMTLSANETMSFNCSMVMVNTSGNGDQLKALCSANSSVNISVFGIEEA